MRPRDLARRCAVSAVLLATAADVLVAGVPLDDIKALFRHDGRVMRVRRGDEVLSLESRMLAVGV